MAKRRARRTRSSHPGVVLAKTKHRSGAVSWRARYKDPATEAVKWATLPAEDARTRESRAEWAKDLAERLTRQRTTITTHGPVADPESIEGAVGAFLETAKRTKRLRERTITTYGLAFRRFREWASEAKVRTTTELTQAHLAALRDYLAAVPKRAPEVGGKRGATRGVEGEVRSPVSVNREMRSLVTLLNDWRRRGLVPYLTTDAITDGLRALDAPLDAPAYLTASQIKSLLAAALRHDADTFAETREEHRGARAVGTTRRYPAIAPFIAFVLLTGCRRGEALSLEWGDVDLDALDASGAAVGELRLRSENVKTKRARTVGLEVSPALRRLLAALKLRAGEDVRVFSGLTEAAAESARVRLVSTFGAPAGWSYQGLRQTAATYLVNAPAIYGAASAFLAAKQLGHSVAVAEKRYAGQLRGLDREARTLDAAMGIERELAAVLADIGTPATSSTAKPARRRLAAV